MRGEGRRGWGRRAGWKQGGLWPTGPPTVMRAPWGGKLPLGLPGECAEQVRLGSADPRAVPYSCGQRGPLSLGAVSRAGVFWAPSHHPHPSSLAFPSPVAGSCTSLCLCTNICATRHTPAHVNKQVQPRRKTKAIYSSLAIARKQPPSPVLAETQRQVEKRGSFIMGRKGEALGVSRLEAVGTGNLQMN